MITREDIQKLSELLDLRKLIDYGQILIEHDDDGVTVHGFEDGPITERMKFDYGDTVLNKKTIEGMCEIAYTVCTLMGIDNNKYAEYRFRCGLWPNMENTQKKLNEIVPRKIQEKLADAGYIIVKEME